MNNQAAVRITLSEPIVVAQAPPELNRAAGAWGRWQFPFIARQADGQIQVRFSIEPDSAESYGKPVGYAQSADNGQTWNLKTPKPSHDIEDGALLPNGDRLVPVQLESKNAKELNLPASVCNFVCSYGYPRSLYRAEDLPRELAGWRFRRRPAGADRWIQETAAVQIPDAVYDVTDEKTTGLTPGVGTVGQVREGPLPLPFCWGKIRIAPDQSLWAVTYQWRLVGGLPKYLPMFFRSTDAGRSWNMISQIPYQGDPQADPHASKRDGFTEPDYSFRPDGSILAVMRTMDGNGHGPLYLAHSLDQGRTWSKPKAFDTFGKMPQLLTLANGVTLASYGASGGPGYFVVRAATDPSGQTWTDPVKTRVSTPEPGAWDTCGHTEMIPLDDRSALIVYSDFNYPDAAGRKRKSILVRKITVN